MVFLSLGGSRLWFWFPVRIKVGIKTHTGITVFEIFILTIMKTKVQMKGLDFGYFHKNLFHRKNKNGKNKKTFVDRNGDLDRRGDRISQLHTQEGQDFSTSVDVFNSLRTRVVSLEPGSYKQWYGESLLERRRPWFHCLTSHKTSSFTDMSD